MGGQSACPTSGPSGLRAPEAGSATHGRTVCQHVNQAPAPVRACYHLSMLPPPPLRCSYFSARAPPPPPKEEGKADGGLAAAGSERMTVQFAQ